MSGQCCLILIVSVPSSIWLRLLLSRCAYVVTRVGCSVSVLVLRIVSGWSGILACWCCLSVDSACFGLLIGRCLVSNRNSISLRVQMLDVTASGWLLSRLGSVHLGASGLIVAVARLGVRLLSDPVTLKLSSPIRLLMAIRMPEGPRLWRRTSV